MTAERLEEIREAINVVDFESPDVPGAIIKTLFSVRAIHTSVVRELLDEIDLLRLAHLSHTLTGKS